MMQHAAMDIPTINCKTMKNTILLFLGMMLAAGSWAQEATEKTFWDDPVNDPMLPIYVVTAFIGVVILLVAFVAIALIRILNMLATQAEKDRAQQLGIEYVPKPSWWDKFLQQMNDSVHVETEETIELDHNYDGIRELDNHLPPWWTWLFIGTIGWSAVYIFVYHFSNSLPLQQEEYQQELTLAAEQAQRLKALQPQAEVDESTLVYEAAPEIIANGKVVFMNNTCGSCHRNDGGGNAIGPNLTDAYWLHGGDVKQIFKTINEGVIEKGMPAWGKSMSPQNVKEVTFYVMSLQGTNPPDAKAPQGELFTPEPVEVEGDSVEVDTVGVGVQAMR
jgi:cytochrome c oxidase cbb3-type subunit 3